MSRSSQFDVEAKAKFREIYESGTSLTKLSADNGVSVPTMSKYVRDAGGTIRGRGRPKKAVVESLATSITPAVEVSEHTEPESVGTERPALFPTEF
jgi:hypothetical protein